MEEAVVVSKVGRKAGESVVLEVTYEKREPIAPPMRTISYLESIGLEKEALYRLSHERIV